jgi:hypothetical protein
MNKKYIVRLSDEERGVCQDIVKRLKLNTRGHSPDKPVWRDVIPDETEVAPGRYWPSNDICKTRRLDGDRDRPYTGRKLASRQLPHGCLCPLTRIFRPRIESGLDAQ